MPATEKVLYTKREAAQLLSISLRSIDYLIFSQQLPARRIGRATAVTTDNLKKVAVYHYGTKEHTQDSVIEGIPFRTSEDADRFAKALHHAIVLCGGKPSAF